VRVNGQPGRVLRGPRETQPDEAQRRAAEQALARVASGDIEADELAELVVRARDRGDGPAVDAVPGEVHVWSVLAVDVVQGRIQTVHIVRNPDKLGHL
jgi:RNA polymerase sigma-70 factor (ECF subfamily)